MKNVRAYLTGTVVLFAAVSLAGCNEEKKIAESDYHEQDTMEETTAHVIVDHLEESCKQEDKTDEFIFEECDDDIVAQKITLSFPALDYKRLANMLMLEEDAEVYRSKSYDDHMMLYNSEFNCESGRYRNNNASFYYANDAGDNHQTYIQFYSWRYAFEGQLYEKLIDKELLYDGVSAEVRYVYPKETIDGYDRDEVIEACEKYAVAMGYKDSEVSTFALDMDVLSIAEQRGMLAPDHDFVTSIPYDILDEYEKNINIAFDSENFELADKLIDEKDAFWEEIFKDNSFESWTKEDEAVLLIYRPKINGMLMDGYQQDLRIIYVPSRDRVVYAEGWGAAMIVEPQNVDKIVPKSEAIAKVKSLAGDSIEIIEVVGVYSINRYLINENKVNPCWRVDYRTSDGRSHTKYVDATTGDENKW